MRRRGFRARLLRGLGSRPLDRIRDLGLGLRDVRQLEGPEGMPEGVELASAIDADRRDVALVIARRGGPELVGWGHLAQHLVRVAGGSPVEVVLVCAVYHPSLVKSVQRATGSWRLVVAPALADGGDEPSLTAWSSSERVEHAGGYSQSLLDRIARVLEGAAVVSGVGGVRRTESGYALYMRGICALRLSGEGDGVIVDHIEPERRQIHVSEGNFPRWAPELYEGVLQLAQDPRLLERPEAQRDGAALDVATAAQVHVVSRWLPWSAEGSEPASWVGVDRVNGRAVIGFVRSSVSLRDVPTLVAAATQLAAQLEDWVPGARTPARIVIGGPGEIPEDVRSAIESAGFQVSAIGADVAEEAAAAFRSDASRSEERERDDRERGRGRRRSRRSRRGRGSGELSSRDRDPGEDDESEATARRARSTREESENEADSEDEGERSERSRGRGRRRRRSGRGSRRERDGSTEDALTGASSEDGAREDRRARRARDVSDGDAKSAVRADREAEGGDLELLPAAAQGAGEDAAGEDRDEPGSEGEEELLESLDEPEAASPSAASPEVPAPRRRRPRAAIAVRSDPESILAALVLARERRHVAFFWVCDQEQLMDFFRGKATDVDDRIDLLLVGFNSQPLPRETIGAAELYRGQIEWYDHHDWAVEDLEHLREAIGPEAVFITEGAANPLLSVMGTTERRSRFTDKIVDLSGRRLSQSDMEKWGERLMGLVQRIASEPGDYRAEIGPILAGRPTELPEVEHVYNAEAEWIGSHPPRLICFGEYQMVVSRAEGLLDPGEIGRRMRAATGARLSLSTRSGDPLVWLGCNEEKRPINILGLVEQLDSKLPWARARASADRAGRLEVDELDQHPERVEELISHIVRHKSVLYG